MKRLSKKATIYILVCIVVLQATVIYLGPSRVYGYLERSASVFLKTSELEHGVVLPTNLVIGDSITDDPLSRFQWGLRMILDGVSYWQVQRDAPRDVVVAVIDSGVHMNHPDLCNKQVPGFNFHDNSPVLRVPEWDGKSPNASFSHGQAAASIVAAEVDNGIGMAGVFHRAFIMPLQNSVGHTSDAINFAIDNGADVILLYGNEGAIGHPMQGGGGNSYARRVPSIQTETCIG